MGGVVVTEASATALRSPVSWGLLGLVIQRPSYGYELVQRFERTYEGALELSSPSQIYTALDTLKRRALVEDMPAAGLSGNMTRQPKPHYRATAKGVRSYREWLISQIEDEHRRSRLFACQLAMLPAADALGVLERYEQSCLSQARHTSIAAPGGGMAEGAGDLAARLLSEQDRLAVGARLSWIEYVRRELTAHSPTRPAR